MKTIAVDEDTWKAIKKLKRKLDVNSYDTVIKILLKKWHSSELEEKLDEMGLDEEESETAQELLNMLKG
ncbi:hypothetical protein [Thermococcus celer]|uniref:Uncharacterized protein n=1 Tax=Thermococcus celer Vu 13 = JCM 8558 TaxID=1293037 RepID=A0A218P176_THECE|nr:hypothetical protein [Thermococcus celer]ASI98672.1 hypothetical protein A3L02_03390 [Thermococcus celer Vu 13 = JCM 8558]